jgi:hypothetical protein
MCTDNIRHLRKCYRGSTFVVKTVGMVMPTHGTVLVVAAVVVMVVVVVVVVPFCSDFGKDNWNCMRITRYVVTAPTICKIIHW